MLTLDTLYSDPYTIESLVRQIEVFRDRRRQSLDYRSLVTNCATRCGMPPKTIRVVEMSESIEKLHVQKVRQQQVSLPLRGGRTGDRTLGVSMLSDVMTNWEHTEHETGVGTRLKTTLLSGDPGIPSSW